MARPWPNPDHVEVAPALDLSGSALVDLWGHDDVPLVYVYPVNMRRKPMIRLEIDGKAVDVRGGLAAPGQDPGCSKRSIDYLSLNRLQAPLKVRWQFAEVDAAWHEARVEVPAFKSDRATIAGRWRQTGLDLYFQADGSVIGERSELITGAGDRHTLRTTGPWVPLNKPPACGTARDRYADTVRVVTD